MKDIVREGFDSATKELKKQQIAEVKKIVLKTLEKIEGKTRERDRLSEEIRLLKMDIDDLKEGKIERIVERQEKDPKAKEASVVIIIKETVVERDVNPWYWPWQITWQTPVYINTPQWNYTGGSTMIGADNDLTYCNATNNIDSGANTIHLVDEGATITGGSGGGTIKFTPPESFCITNSAAKDGVVGSYTVENKVVHLR